MKNKDIALINFWIFLPLIIIFSFFLSGCTLVQLKEAETVVEVAEDAEQAVEYFVKKEESHVKVINKK